jgi:hypothetical protein
VNWRTGIVRLYVAAWAVGLAIVAVMVTLRLAAGTPLDQDDLARKPLGWLLIFAVLFALPGLGLVLLRWIISGFWPEKKG